MPHPPNPSPMAMESRTPPVLPIYYPMRLYSGACHSVAFQTRVGRDVQAALGTGGLTNSTETTVHLLLTSGDEPSSFVIIIIIIIIIIFA